MKILASPKVSCFCTTDVLQLTGVRGSCRAVISASRQVGKSASRDVGKSASRQIGKSEGWDMSSIGHWQLVN
jgi:hypothetical protein